jgi:hypothetical protein
MATATHIEVPIPETLKDRPISDRGFLVPWFVHYDEKGEPDFRIMDMEKLRQAVGFNKCWMCGGQLRGGVNYPFVVGPMCIVNRISTEPPSHAECARYAAMVCPFLTRPHAKRREIAKPVHMADGAILRNPGVTALAFSRSYEITSDKGGTYFHFEKPIAVEWYCEGRAATRAEVQQSIDSGLPELRAFQEFMPPDKRAKSERDIQNALKYLPRK